MMRQVVRFHLLLIAYLAYRSSFVPKLLTVLLAIAGLGYLFDSFGRAAGSSPDVSAFTFIGEFLLALWLVTRGRRITLSDGISRRSDRCSPLTAARHASDQVTSPPSTSGARMRAIIQRHHGTADRLRKAEIDRPGIRAGEVP